MNKTKTPEISIVLPFYNSEIYIAEAIESILSQTFTAFEVLAISDGSVDKSVSILRKFNDDRIKIIIKEHNFINALNFGLKNASGKYIVRMDADDIMLKDRLKVQFDYMETHIDIDICGSWAEKFGGDFGIIEYSSDHETIISSLLLYNSVIHPTVIMRKSTILRFAIQYSDYKCAEDYKFWTDLALAGARFANIPIVLLLYRVSLGQSTNRYRLQMSKNSHNIKLEYAEEIMNKIIEEDERYGGFFCQLIQICENQLLDPIDLPSIVYQIYKKKLQLS